MQFTNMFAAGAAQSPGQYMGSAAVTATATVEDSPASSLFSASLSTLPVTFNSSKNATVSGPAFVPQLAPALAPAAGALPVSSLSSLPISFSSRGP